MSAQEDVLKRAGSYLKDAMSAAYNGKDMKGFNKAIGHIGRNYMGAPEAVGRVLKGEGFGESMVKTFTNKARDGVNSAGEKIIEHDGWNYGKIAGSYIGVAAAGRIATGGGLYRDGNGNTNLIGVPFV